MSKLTIQIPLVIHLLAEIPASLSFLLAPRAQLPSASQDAVLILRNFGGLLMSTNLLAVVFLFRGRGGGGDDGNLAGWVLLCLGSYHFWPVWRAWDRMNRLERTNKDDGGREKKEQKKVLGGPVVHFGVHLVCLVVLAGGGFMNL
ncbi:hypothetical protein QBC44DRAFT_261741 [Cladorrhinum sp. PSN332]|nr:hypothetical protein QBC44DRAFT_261741 [Cladorrhinum sp. PSN332]